MIIGNSVPYYIKKRSAQDASRRDRYIVAFGNTRLARRVSLATLFVLYFKIQYSQVLHGLQDKELCLFLQVH